MKNTCRTTDADTKAILDAFSPLFASCNEIRSIGFWVANFSDGSFLINDEDVLINGTHLDGYEDKQLLDVDMSLGEIVAILDRFGNYDIIAKLKVQTIEAKDNVNKELGKNPVLQAIQKFDLTRVDTALFTKYLGRHFPWNHFRSGVFFTVHRNGLVEHDGR